MADTSDWWLAIPKPVRTLPADLAAILALLVLTVVAVFVPGVRETPLRVVLGLPFVLFVPGYAFIAALFPEAGPDLEDTTTEADAPDRPNSTGADDEADDDAGGLREKLTTGPTNRDGGIDGIERVALSFGLSIAIVPLIGLALNFTPFGIRLVPIMVSLAAFTLAAVAVAARRRRELPVDDRFTVPYAAWFAAGRDELLNPDSRGDAALNVLLVASILLAAASVGYAVAVPKDGEQFSEFYVLTENETGALVADDYPTNYTASESKPVVVGVGNHEGRTENYTVVVALQRVELVDNETNVSVLEQRQLDSYTTRVADNETALRNVSITPTMTGEDLRVVFLLYAGDAPPDPTAENAYRELHLWVNVTEGTNATTSVPVEATGPGDWTRTTSSVHSDLRRMPGA
ncbi:DUF1616 domain-containing protein [Halorubellus litoreus]|uniref:DUF1616 domain-containing protein n=1 Tax=Halorubellus litoreus TaxID=755308 RepID=A0ABD5VIA7_9EURY